MNAAKRLLAAPLLGVVTLALGAWNSAHADITRAERETAWETQARGISKAIAQPSDTEEKIVEAYVAARAKVQDFVESVESKGEDIHKHIDGYMKITGEERDKLKASLSEFLSEADVTAALDSLGTFSRQWDRAVVALSKFKLEGDKQSQAFTAAATYAKEIDAARKKAMGTDDTKAMMASFGEAREKLYSAVGKVLTAEQLTTFKAETAMGGSGAKDAKPTGENAKPAPAQ
jgi:hypothetical protein